jgi:hypothetical protein
LELPVLASDGMADATPSGRFTRQARDRIAMGAATTSTPMTVGSGTVYDLAAPVR